VLKNSIVQKSGGILGIESVQPSKESRLWVIVAAPTLFLPLGIVLVSSSILPRLFGYLALILATAFAALGAIFLLDLTLPGAVTAFAGVQALWWLAAAITLIGCPQEKQF
jgi:hypothetical protein